MLRAVLALGGGRAFAEQGDAGQGGHRRGVTARPAPTQWPSRDWCPASQSSPPRHRPIDTVRPHSSAAAAAAAGQTDAQPGQRGPILRTRRVREKRHTRVPYVPPSGPSNPSHGTTPGKDLSTALHRALPIFDRVGQSSPGSVWPEGRDGNRLVGEGQRHGFVLHPQFHGLFLRVADDVQEVGLLQLVVVIDGSVRSAYRCSGRTSSATTGPAAAARTAGGRR